MKKFSKKILDNSFGVIKSAKVLTTIKELDPQKFIVIESFKKMQRAEIKRYFDENRKKWCIRKFPNDKHSRLKDNSKIQAIVSILGAEQCLRYFGVFRYVDPDFPLESLPEFACELANFDLKDLMLFFINFEKRKQIFESNKNLPQIFDAEMQENLKKIFKITRLEYYKIVITIFKDILEALTALHQNFIAHLDIKPENLVYFVDSKNAKIIDFETSHIQKVINGVCCPFLNGTEGFTKVYVAPERVDSNFA